MNKYYSYKNFELWNNENWEDHKSNINGLVQWIQGNSEVNPRSFQTDYTGDLQKHPGYRTKTSGIDDPAIIQYWADRGICLTVLSQGGKRWVSMVPEQAIQDRSHRLPAVVVYHLEDYSDPWWAMKTVEYYKEYNEKLAASRDFMLIYVVTEGPDEDMIYLNIMQEAFILYPADLEKLYVDISSVRKKGVKLSEIPDFRYPADPEGAVETFGQLDIPVINISGIWGNRDSLLRGLVMYFKANDGKFDREWLIHSQTGKRMMDGIVLEHQYDDLYHEDLIRYWADMGLKFEAHDMKGEQWTSMVPLCAFDQPEKELPVILVMQEVYHGNEHLALSSKSYFYQNCEIAAQGECILLFFAMEDPDSNDMWVEILEEATKKYPIDRSRVYITGHSHDGFFSYEFAYRHPDIVAAVATLGDPRGLRSPEVTGNPVMSISDEQLEELSRVDLPVINLAGTNEGFGVIPTDPDDYAEFVESWQRRLKASRCPAKTFDEVKAVGNSDDYVARILGVPTDKTWSVWADGVEHYLGEVKNVDGKAHLCIGLSQNMPHTTTPFMLNLAWTFLRRFSRDLETGEIVELY